MLAHLFALWTLKNADFYFDADKNDRNRDFLLQPHPAQVIALFRMLSIADEERQLANNLIEIGTGEGKSVTLAVAACVFGLMGFDVSVACYSEYLSERDYESFRYIFDALNLRDRVFYGTFNQISEREINKRGSIRDSVKAIIMKNAGASVNNLSTTNDNTFTKITSAVTSTVSSAFLPFFQPSSPIIRPKILLIDEVDVFFNEDFFGNMYYPSSELQSSAIFELMKSIWAKRSQKLRFMQVKNTSQYQACCRIYQGWEFLVESAAMAMLNDVHDFQAHDYVVINNKIGYKEQDGISFDISFGYKTAFAYFYEKSRNAISDISLKENVGLIINCGAFSYAEMPKSFQYIVGVTGTLKTLSAQEKEIILNNYGINKFTYMPSVFGKNNISFREEKDVFVESKDDYFLRITQEINDRMVGNTESVKRAILVFFESKEALHSYANSRAFDALRDAACLMTEEVSNKEKESYIKRATTSGQVTLLVRTFGRGCDFVCRDVVVASNGGPHVIQTFLSEAISEETQIKGRTARQGDQGSYSMVLLDDALEKFTIKPEEIKTARSRAALYPLLNNKRNTYFAQKYAGRQSFVDKARIEHQHAEQFVGWLHGGVNLEKIKNYLKGKNRTAMGSHWTKTICLMDATYSMGQLLEKSKNTVGTMFERAHAVLKVNGIETNCFQIQFAVYRNYNCKENNLLQYSTWESSPENLWTFMNQIQPTGGWGNEAIEIGLWHVNEELKNNEVSQVILIGDAPANKVSEVREKRGTLEHSLGEAYWQSTKFKEPTDYQKELNHMKQHWDVPIHAFFVDTRAASNFRKIARQTGGRCESLDINSPQGAELLTDVVTEEVLRKVGEQAGGQGDTLVETYRKSFKR